MVRARLIRADRSHAFGRVEGSHRAAERREQVDETNRGPATRPSIAVVIFTAVHRERLTRTRRVGIVQGASHVGGNDVSNTTARMHTPSRDNSLAPESKRCRSTSMPPSALLCRKPAQFTHASQVKSPTT